MLGNLGFGEMMVIMIIVLLLFGAKRVPEISASFGQGIREFKRNLNDVEGSITGAAMPRFDERPAPRSPSPIANEPDATPREPKRLL